MSIHARRRASSYDSGGRFISDVYRITFQAQGGPSHTPGGSKRVPNSRRFRPGETVRQSGIYEVMHDREHRDAHEVVMINGDAFPDCDTCKERVRFRLVRTAPYIFQDQDFEDDPV